MEYYLAIQCQFRFILIDVWRSVQYIAPLKKKLQRIKSIHSV